MLLRNSFERETLAPTTEYPRRYFKEGEAVHSQNWVEEHAVYFRDGF